MSKAEFILTPATGKYFIGRKELISELFKEALRKKSHIGFCLYGRRRIGKTSALMELKYLLRDKKDVVVVYLSLYDLADLSLRTFGQELVNIISSAYQEKGLLPIKIKMGKLLGASLDVVMELLKNAKIQASVLEQIKLIIESGEKKENYSEYIRHAFNLSEKLAESTSTKCVLILDEFPEILRIENGAQLVKMLRTQYETQKNVSLIISGSIKKTLEMVAISENSPFYKQLVPKHLLPFSEEETEEFLKSYMGKVDRAEARKLHKLTGGLPFYLQFIGRSTEYRGDIDQIIDNFVKQEGSLFFKEEFEKLSDKEKLIVISLSKGMKTLTDIAKETEEPTTTIGRYLPILMEKEVIIKEFRGSYLILDSLFGYWVKQKYGNAP
jgi:AAA+ ATPase superfamily predicted ATPase